MPWFVHSIVAVTRRVCFFARNNDAGSFFNNKKPCRPESPPDSFIISLGNVEEPSSLKTSRLPVWKKHYGSWLKADDTIHEGNRKIPLNPNRICKTLYRTLRQGPYLNSLQLPHMSGGPSKVWFHFIYISWKRRAACKWRHVVWAKESTKTGFPPEYYRLMANGNFDCRRLERKKKKEYFPLPLTRKVKAL